MASKSGFISIQELANFRLKREASNGQDYWDAGLDMMGGCQGCGASLAAYNGYPSKSGYWQCHDCIEASGNGWKEVEEAMHDIFAETR